jgi:hypothetical protein
MPIGKYTKKYYQIEFQTPGYARRRFRCSSGTKTKKTAESYETHLLTLYHEGRFDLLNRVKEGKLSPPKLKEQMDQKGVQGLLKYVADEEQKARESAAELRGLLEKFLADPDLGASESTREDYRTQIEWYLRTLEDLVSGAQAAGGKAQSRKTKKQVAVTASHGSAPLKLNRVEC